MKKHSQQHTQMQGEDLKDSEEFKDRKFAFISSSSAWTRESDLDTAMPRTCGWKGWIFLRKVPTLFFLAHHLEAASLWKFGQTREQQESFWNRSHAWVYSQCGKHKPEKSSRAQQETAGYAGIFPWTLVDNTPAQGPLQESSVSSFKKARKKWIPPSPPSYYPTTISKHLTLVPYHPHNKPILLLLPRIRLQCSFNCHTHSDVYTLC